MSAVIEVNDLTKHYGRMRAVDGIGFALEENRIDGLLGRNGAGKTTLMSMLTGQEFASSGEIRVFGRSPVENAAVLSRTCFIKESQKYPDDFRVKHVLRSAPWFFDGWDEAFARELVEDFRLPVDRKIKKLSRGQLSAIGVVVGLASRAPLTFFDEPYLGLDAVARQLFYDRLLQDFAEHPRTVVLSTHLIDEVSSLLEHVLVMDEGRLVVYIDAEELRGAAATVIGPRQAVESFTAGREVIARSALGSRASATLPRLDYACRASAARHGLELESVPLQQLVVQLTTGKASE
ncbi:ABC transporter ATP-binding protein [Rathayibacter sp. AY2B3]|uniref:ABC transporter ATP-binding protein n=1 Tax=Rathayibacter sp. AY2B3 TaxID=2080569 RepID=UPI000CE746B0|nr:ABC transporter ATP-binding protein [Rathayibacter sp. AY2B3]PPG49191.1 ABC transporter ATP-binding protein [Rathayibacter sp. AY2B3]